MIFLSFLFSLILCFSSYAATATPSDLDLDEKYEVFMEDLQDEEYQVDLGELPVDSDSDLQNFSEFASDLFVGALKSLNLAQADPDDGDSPTSVTEAVEHIMLMNNFDPSDPDAMGFHKNVVVFTGSFNNYDCQLVVPYSDYEKLDIIDGHLINIGSGSVTGKILYDGESLDPSQYDSYVYVLNPVYGSTNNVYNYGSFNYRRHYYLNSSSSYNRISYEDMYGNFTVSDTDVYYSSSERIYYLGLVLIFLLGGVLICRRH